MQTESMQVQDNSIDLIFTDLPYHEKQLDLYRWLFLHADRVLKTGGSLVTYAVNYAIPQIIHYYSFTKNLQYYWILAVEHSGPFSSFFAKNILVKWKPLAWFVKHTEGQERNKEVKPKIQNGRIFDLIHATRFIIEQLTKPGDTVFDPFMGSGATGIAEQAIYWNRNEQRDIRDSKSTD